MTSKDTSILTEADVNVLIQEAIQKMRVTYETGRDRTVRPETVFQEAVLEGQAVFEEFVNLFLLPGSKIEGLEHFDDCLERLGRGESVILLPEHRGNFDTPTFHVLLRREGDKYKEVIDRLIYVAGRKLNESSELVDMFSEKYSRLVLVPKREMPAAAEEETEKETREREAYEQLAGRINRAAFRQLLRLRKAGRIFVLFPLGGREKPGADNIPVRETTSYLKSFDAAYPVSMEGNVLLPRDRMEDERPIRNKVVFRIGRPLICQEFLKQQRGIYDRAQAEGRLGEAPDYEQFTVERIMKMLEQLRKTGEFDPSFPP